MSGSEHNLNRAERLDLLVSRIADGEADPRHWAELEALAATDPAVWKVLAQAQRDQAALSVAVGVALHAADRVDLPSLEAAGSWRPDGAPRPVIRTWTRLGAFSGWAAAACVAMAWAGVFKIGDLSRQGAGNNAAILNVSTPEDALQAYYRLGGERGSVVGELPQQRVLDSRRVVGQGGQRGIEVLVVRQIVEREFVNEDDLSRLGLDETGRPVPVKASLPVRMIGAQ